MTYIATANTTVIVNKESDFPAPSAGSITLVDNITYFIGNSFTMTNKLITGANNCICAWSSRNTIVSYSGTGDFITLGESNFDLTSIGFSCPTAQFMTGNGGVLDPQDPKIITVRELAVFGCTKFATLTNISINFDDAGCFADDGITFISSGGANFVCALTDWTFFNTDAGATGVDFGTSVFDNIVMQQVVFDGGGIGIDGATASANMSSGRTASITRCNFDNITTPLSGIATDDVRWEFKDCSGLSNSIKACEVYTSAATTVTIGTAGVYVPIGGANFVEQLSSRFTTDTAGNITFNGEIAETFFVLGTATIQKVGGGTDQLCMRLAHDTGGGYVTQARSGSCTENASATTVVCQGLFTLNEGDRITLYVENTDSTSNITVDLANLTLTNGL